MYKCPKCIGVLSYFFLETLPCTGALYYILLHVKNDAERARLMELVVLNHVAVLDADLDGMGTLTSPQQVRVCSFRNRDCNRAATLVSMSTLVPQLRRESF